MYINSSNINHKGIVMVLNNMQDTTYNLIAIIRVNVLMGKFLKQRYVSNGHFFVLMS